MRGASSLWHHDRLVHLAIAAGLMALAASTGCSSSANVTLLAQFASGSSNPAANNGDGNTDNWADNNLTPTGFAMGIQSATLTGSDGSSFTIFDQGVDGGSMPNALFTRFYNSPTTVNFGYKTDIDNGTYDTLELQLVYYENEVDAYQDATLHPRRMRTYLQDYFETLIGKTVTAYDMLIGNGSPTDFTVPTSGDYTDVGSTGQDLSWIDPVDGSRCAQRSDCLDGGIPYQVPTTVFPSATVKIPLTGQEIVVDSDTDANFVITLTAQIEDLFFYDETDAGAPENALFNYLSDSSSSLDGKIQDACTTSDCSGGGGNKQQADFWIGPPQFKASVMGQ